MTKHLHKYVKQETDASARYNRERKKYGARDDMIYTITQSAAPKKFPSAGKIFVVTKKCTMLQRRCKSLNKAVNNIVNIYHAWTNVIQMEWKIVTELDEIFRMKKGPPCHHNSVSHAHRGGSRWRKRRRPQIYSALRKLYHTKFKVEAKAQLDSDY